MLLLRIFCYTFCVVGPDDISKEIQILLQLAEEELLVRTIWGLSPEQKRSQVFKDIGNQRYLSALRGGGIDNAEMTKNAFKIDPFFSKSKIAMDAASIGFKFKVESGKLDVAEKIKKIMGTSDLLPAPKQVGGDAAVSG